MAQDKKELTIKFVSDILVEKNLLSESQYKDVVINGELQIKKLKKRRASSSAKRRDFIEESPTPAEIISSFNLDIPDRHGKILTEDAITEAIAEATGCRYRKIDPLMLNLKTVTSYISKPFARKHLLVPIGDENGVVTIAVADPFKLDAIEEIKRAKRLKADIVLSSKNDILKVVRQFYGFGSSVTNAEKETSPGFEIGNLEQYFQLKADRELDATDKHVVNAVEHLLQHAFDQRASDIHIEPKRNVSHIRFRIDGILHYIHEMPKAVHLSVVSRIKMLARLDISEKRRPQDGRIKTNYSGKDIELRVSTLPVAFGEKIVIRVFDPDVLLQEIDQLGFYPREHQLFNSFIHRPNGVILVTGPTGSGKTTTLYSALNILSSSDVNITTIEDPIEMVTEKFNQVGIQHSVGITFGTALRTILRQDPDIIMVGEIRDRETVENAIQAALTGHLVLSTLHTNDAPSTITRLLDLQVPPFLISSTVVGVIAQRLVRKICPDCKKKKVLSPDACASLQFPPRQVWVYHGEGCRECRNTGYRGRTGVFEVVDMTDRLQGLVAKNAAPSDIRDAARTDGMMPLKECAIRKMLEGITTYEEVIGITG